MGAVAGWMGTQMAQVYATAGLEVRLTDTTPDALPAALDRIRANLAETNPGGAAAVLDRITVHRELTPAVQGAALVQESVPENLALKQQVFQAVEALVAPETVLGTNTSSLSAVGQYIYSTTGDARFRPNPMMEAAVAEGRYGVAQGAGFYDYSTEDIPTLLQERDRGIREVLAFLQSRTAK